LFCQEKYKQLDIGNINRNVSMLGGKIGAENKKTRSRERVFCMVVWRFLMLLFIRCDNLYRKKGLLPLRGYCTQGVFWGSLSWTAT
jgi:hypothetical protein